MQIAKFNKIIPVNFESYKITLWQHTTVLLSIIISVQKQLQAGIWTLI